MGCSILWALVMSAFAYLLFEVGGQWLMLALGVAPGTADTAATAAWLLSVVCLVATQFIGGGPPASVDVTHGSARFMNAAGRLKLTQGGGLIIGRDPDSKKLVRFDGEAHLLTIAPTRSGKGVGTIIPNLLTYDGPVVCIDPKGENARVTAERRRGFGAVYVVDPYGVSGEPTAFYNPLDTVDPDRPEGVDAAAALADALVADPPHQIGDAHWNEEARALIAGLLLYIAADHRPDRRTLARLRELLTLPPKHFAALLDDMAASDAAHGLVARAANRHLGKADREGAGVISSAQRHTHFLDAAAITTVTARSSFTLDALGRDGATLFVALPPDKLAAQSRWLRLMVAQLIAALTARGPAARDGTSKATLLLLDEFAALGRLEPVLRAMGVMAGYGLRLWPILQDLHQLRSLYGQEAGSFLSNAGCVQLFNVNDIETAEWVSRALGETTVREYSSAPLDEGGGAIFDRTTARSFDYDGDSDVKRPLLTADEVRRLPSDEQLVILSGRPPLRLLKIRIYDDGEFRVLGPRDRLRR